MCNQLVVTPVSRLVGHHTIHVERRMDLVSHSGESPGTIFNRIMWTETTGSHIDNQSQHELEKLNDITSKTYNR